MRSTSWAGRQSSMPCANPGTCLFCLDCGIPTSAPTNSSAQAQYDAPSLQNIDDWLREVSAVPSFQSPNIQLDSPFSSILGQGQPDTRFDPAMLQTYALWSSLQNGQAQSQLSRSIPQECCGGRCKCPAGMCACAADCCGCCQGCQCPECEHGDDPNKILTFAVSGERGSCCGGAHTHGRTETYAPHVPVAGPSGANINGGVGSIRNEGRDEGTVFRGPNDGWFDQSLTLPRTSTLSRASSRSSKSSSQQSYQSSSPAPYTDGVGVSHGMGADMHVVRACCASMEMINTSMSIDGSSNSPSPGPPDRTNDVVDYAQSSRMF
ncbi:hypothetical protein A0H81_13600 [Grifola frondosa]|uniref:Uncharacterized protein n=1 Tax=Grifola frondosa TaxID=5627 RepID=A0A1C7LNX6_GRIFR|nr:hypothetical protein A0H81_13600 [Grifola frondosa]